MSAIRSVSCGHSAGCWRPRRQPCSLWIRASIRPRVAAGIFRASIATSRFAKDKTPYRAQMYLKFCAPFPGDGETGELYAGISAKSVTAGFRIYAGSKYKESALAQIAHPRSIADPGWSARQKKRLERALRKLLVRRRKGRMDRAIGLAGFRGRLEKAAGVGCSAQADAGDRDSRRRSPPSLAKIFRDVYPLLRFTSLPE